MPCRKSLCVVFLFLFALAPALVRAQTSSSALVTGTVYDPSQAVVPGATVELRDKATNVTLTQNTNALGAYTFPTVQPGTYKVTVTAQGFRTSVIPGLKVTVAQSFTVNVTLEIGTATQTVEVQATPAVELQKTDATVGDVIGGDELKYLPTPNRQVSGLLLLQPLVMPLTAGQDTGTGGQVAGARSDQTVFLLDGGDATNDTEGSGGYNTQFAGEIRPMIPVPAESIEEFRVGTTNPNATFGRSQGAQVAMVTKRGTNNVHGSAYWYHQNDNLNANSWDLNASGIKRPELKDNRYGGTLGGPILKDRLWLFGHYEGRRFPQTTTRTKVVPTATLRQGILQYKDAAGTIIQYNMNLANGPISTACTGGNCDPRNRGASSVILADLNQLPVGTPGASGGDGLNLVGWRGVVNTAITSEFGVARADYKINDKWNFFGTGRYYYYKQPGQQQIDIVGISGCSAPCSTRLNPLQPRYYSAGVNGQLRPTLLSETRFSWYRHWWQWATKAPFPQVSGTAAPLSLAGEGTGNTGSVKIADPINIDTQNGRSRVWNGKDTFIGENLTWLKGKHTWQFGGSYRFENIFHQRTDKVTGGLTTSPIFYTGASFVSIPDANRPTACPSFTPPAPPPTNCLKSSDKNRWNQQYATLLGIVDKAAQILTRDGDLNPQPLTTPFSAQVHIHAVEGYFQDIFKLSNSFTLTYGLTYQVQRPPTEATGRQMVPVFAATQAPLNLKDYFQSRATAAVQGNIVNPDISYVPIKHLIGQSFVSNVDWNNFGPRIAGAWNPSFNNFLFGNRKTVIRGGYSVTFTRMNGVGLVMTPILGVGLGNVLACLAPQFNIATPCATSSSTTPTNAFRVGVDGTGSSILPSTLPVASAAIPFPVSKPYGETRSFMIDPGFKPGYSHSFDLTWQRELPWNMLMEVGYVGRLGRNLVQNADVNSTPFMFLDKVSGQTLAAAFDAVATALRNGTTVTAQPWFENIVGAGATVSLANNFSFDFQVGDLGAIMQSTAGRCVPGPGCVTGSGGGVDIRLFDLGRQPIDNIQTQVDNFTSDRGTSDYHAGFVSLHKRFSQGLTFDANYTYGHSIDLFGLNQENTQFSYTSPYNRDLDREPSIWDARHVINFHWYHELPFGRGKRYSTASSVLDKFIGGWHWAGIWTYRTGLPLCPFGGFSDWLNASNYGAPNGAACLVAIDSKFRPTATPNFGVLGDPTTGAGTNADPANGGNSLNIFSSSDLVKVFNNYRYPLLTQDGRFAFGHIHGMGNWNIDMSLGKRTSIRERYAVTFTVDFLNAFNHVVFGDPSLDITDPASFGVISGQFGNPRFIQLGLRVEF